jgi:hypothetical protein
VRNETLEPREVELDVLDRPREVHHDEDTLVFELAEEGQDPPVLGEEELERAVRQRSRTFAQRDQPLHPP